MAELIELRTLLAGPHGVLPPGQYPADVLRQYGFVVASTAAGGDGAADEVTTAVDEKETAVKPKPRRTRKKKV